MQNTKRPFVTLFSALLMLVSPMMMPGCVPTMLEDGGGTTTSLTLTIASVVPGGIFGVRHDSIKTGDTVKVRFVGTNGFDITVDTIAASDGETRVAAPPLINTSTGAFETGDVTVTIEGVSSERLLSIESLPVLEGWARGELMIAVLEQSISNFNDAIANTEELGVEFATITVDDDIANLQAAIVEATALRDQLRDTGGLEYQLSDESTTTLSGDDIDALERHLAGILLGASQELQQSESQASKVDEIQNLQFQVNDTAQGVGFSRQDFEDFISSLEQGVRSGSVLLTGLSVGVGIVGLIAAPELAGIAAAGGIAVAGFTAIYSFSTSTAVRASGRALLDNAGTAWVTTQEALAELKNIRLSYLGAVPGRIGQLFTIVSATIGTRDTYNGIVDIKCDSSNKLIGQQQVAEFCVISVGDAGDQPDTQDPVDVADDNCGCAADEICSVFVNPDGTSGFNCFPCEEVLFGTCPDSMDTGSSDSEKCEITGCEEGEVCCDSVCSPNNDPTEGTCPTGLELDLGVFSPAIQNLNLDRFEISQSVGSAASCIYVRSDGGGGEYALVLFHADGRCGVEDDDGDGIVIDTAYSSTARTLSATLVVTGNGGVVDGDAVLREFLNNAITVEVGAACCK